MTDRCPSCEWRPFTASLREPDGPEGFSPLPNFAGYVKRCTVCRDKHYDEQRASERTLEAMYAYELAGSEEGARELLAGIDLGIPTTLPGGEVSGDAFFLELPAHKTVELTLLPIPYRNLIFTGVLPPEDSQGVGSADLSTCPKCGQPYCTKNHAEFM